MCTATASPGSNGRRSRRAVSKVGMFTNFAFYPVKSPPTLEYV
jgi:hypothetical protein